MKKKHSKRSGAFRYLLMLCVALSFMIVGSTVAFAAEETVSVPVKNTGYEAQLVKTYTINKATPKRIIPLNVSQAGTIWIDLKVRTLQRYMNADVYTDAACTNRLSGFYGYLQTGDTSYSGKVSVSTAGTYYLKLDANALSSTGAFTNTIDVCLGEYTNSIKTLSSSIRYYRINGKDIHRFKYTANKTGKVFVTVGTGYGYYVKLEDGNKNALNSGFAYISSSSSVHKGRIGYAVKKGKTYHFAVKSIGSNELQTISVSAIKTVKEKSGATKRKAKTLKAKKKANGLLLAGENKSDWYKLTLKKTKKLTITLKGEPNTDQNSKDGFKISVYNKKGKLIGSSNLKYSNKGVYKVTNGTKYGYASKGKYYIKISPLTKKRSSGYYTLSWK